MPFTLGDGVRALVVGQCPQWDTALNSITSKQSWLHCFLSWQQNREAMVPKAQSKKKDVPSSSLTKHRIQNCWFDYKTNYSSSANNQGVSNAKTHFAETYALIFRNRRSFSRWNYFLCPFGASISPFCASMYVPSFSYLCPLIALSMLTDFKAFAPFCTSQGAVLLLITWKSHPVTCIWLIISHKVSSLYLNTSQFISVLNHR